MYAHEWMYTFALFMIYMILSWTQLKRNVLTDEYKCTEKGDDDRWRYMKLSSTGLRLVFNDFNLFNTWRIWKKNCNKIDVICNYKKMSVLQIEKIMPSKW